MVHGAEPLSLKCMLQFEIYVLNTNSSGGLRDTERQARHEENNSKAG